MPGIILINPEVFQDSRDAMAVCVNEALRLFMEDTRFKPDFEPTPEQQKFFRGTTYADNPNALKKTILARVATFDTSVSPTPEETSETRRLLSLVMEAIGKKHRDYPLMKRLHDQVGKTRPKAPAVPASIGEPGTEQDDELGGNVALGKLDPATWGKFTGKPSIRAAAPVQEVHDEIYADTSNMAGPLRELFTDKPETGNPVIDTANVALDAAARFGAMKDIAGTPRFDSRPRMEGADLLNQKGRYFQVHAPRIEPKPPKTPGKINLKDRPCGFSCFSADKASLAYAYNNPTHYVTVSDGPMVVSTAARHGKGSTRFPANEEGTGPAGDGMNPKEQREVWAAMGDGTYRLSHRYDYGTRTLRDAKFFKDADRGVNELDVLPREGTTQDDELGGEVAVPTALRMTLGSPASVPGPARVMPPKPTYLDPIKANPMEAPTVTLVPAPQPVPDKARTIDRVVDILSDIESKNNPGAIGDQGRAEGLLQMWKIQVDEANRLAGKTKWTYQDRKDPEKSKAMAREFLSHKFDKGVTNPIQLAGMWRNPRGNAPLWYLNKAREAQIGLEE